MNALQKIQGVATSQQFLPGDSDYPEWENQYASSSHETDHNMRPGLIVRATSKQDIKAVISQARQLKNAIAIRTGGHQYSGASSTGPGNILLDLRDTFKTPDDLVYFKEAGYVRSSVSWALADFNEFLGKNQCFVPHGQCQSVHVGGHMQTGGYGQLGRSFGLFGDHITSFEIIDYEGKEREITRADTELFFAWLGGSPGNLGVLTHFSVKVYRDADYIGSRGLKVLHLYNEERLRQLLHYLAEMSDNDEFPRNYDLCVSVLSGNANILGYMSGMEDDVAEKHPEVYDEEGGAVWPRMIVVYAQWTPFSPTDKPDLAWFERLRLNSWFASKVQIKPMSEPQAGWIFRHDREFEWPYVKRTYLTNSRELSTNGWVEWVVARMNEVMEPLFNGMKVSAQLQVFGGKYSRFRTNADNGTSYSWRRDSTLCATIDCFHKPSKKAEAEAWQAVNDKEGLGPNGKFGKQDRRVLWGSYGSFDLDSVWNCYHEDRAKYERLMRARKAADPEGIFTPNTFSVKRAA